MRSRELDRAVGVLVLVLVLLSAGACSTVDPRPDFEAARREIRATTAEADVHDPGAPALSASEIEAVLADGLGLDEATRLALLENRRLQAGFQRLGVARADYVQAGLLENPSLSLAFLFPDGGGRVRWAADLVGSVADVWRIPSRRALAKAGLEEQVLELSRFAGELVASVRETYFRGVAAREEIALAREGVELARRSLEGVRRRIEAGAASRIDEGLEESALLLAELASQRAESGERTLKRELAALLSSSVDLLSVPLIDRLPDPISLPLEREAAVQRFAARRTDVRAAERAVVVAEERLALERRGRLPGLNAGVSAERPEGGGSTDLLVGPAATLELPLFDLNHAQVRRAELELVAVRKEHEALLAEASQEIRAALDRSEAAARTAAFARDELVPQAERSSELAGRAYELGDTTVLTLLQARRAELDARRIRVESLLYAALARIAAERATGAPLGRDG